MTDTGDARKGGCLCGAFRYEAIGVPLFAGLCYCADCRKASGSGSIPFIGFTNSAVRFTGQTRQFKRVADSGREYVHNFCPVCSSMVFGGNVGEAWLNIYAGSLDDPTLFHPSIAIYTCSRAPWVEVPLGLEIFEKLPVLPSQ